MNTLTVQVHRSRHCGCIAAGLLAISALVPAWAENNSNYVFNGSTTNFGAAFTVGNGGTNNSLSISNAGAVTNTSGTVGSGGNNNSALVTDSHSIWNNSGSLTIGGGTESGNQLTVTNGGLVIGTGGGYIGFDATSLSNSVTITGTGSIWTNIGSGNDLYIGRSGAFDTLTIANSGQVFNANGYIGANASASNNTVIVSDPASLWRNSVDLYVGQSGVGNQLIVTNGATVIGVHGYLGYSTASSNNVVVVSESGSLWSNTSSLFVGRLSQGNKLTVANGARVSSVGLTVGNSGATNNQMWILNGGVVTNTADAIISQDAASLSNSVVVSGLGSVWANGANTLYMGEGGPGNSLTISNAGRVFNGVGYVGFNAGSSNNTLTVTGSGSVWSNTAGITVGNSASLNLLTIANSGTVYNTTGVIGANAGGSNNTVTVTGSASVWSNTSTLVIGNDGAGNRLTISNGGSVYNSSYAYLGFNSAGASNNVVTVTDSNSLWNTGSGNFGIGRSSPGNQLIVSNGALVIAGTAFAGASISGTTSYSNSVIVTGPGSVWSNSTMSVGNYGYGDQVTVTTSGHVYTTTLSLGGGAGSGTGYGNTLLITNGGRVDSLTSYVSIGDGGVATSNNLIIVTGTGSVLNLPIGNLHIGRYGANNQMIVTNGGLVVDNVGLMGNNGGSNGLVVVTDPGSVWTNTSGLTVGVGGAGHRVVVTNFAQLVSGSTLYSGNGASGNQIVVAATGKVTSVGLYVGFTGGSNSLNVSSGGQLFNTGNTKLGDGNSSVTLGLSNSMVVTGPGSIFTNSGNLYVGDFGGYNSLTVSAGGQVVNGGTYFFIGNNGGTNSVLVTDSGTIVTNSGGDIYLGNAGNGNQLTIASTAKVVTAGVILGNGGGAGNLLTVTNGAKLYSSDAFIVGSAVGANNNSVVITGAGSAVTSTSLTVGSSGAGNKLTIADGGQFFDTPSASATVIGAAVGSSNNQVVVTGSGSVWSNTFTLYIGSAGGYNQLIITNGGKVYSGGNVIGGGINAVSNSVVVTGPGSLWQASSTIWVGTNSPGTSQGIGGRVLVQNGATVEATSLVSGFNSSGIFSNSGGVYQFVSASPTITANTSGTIILSNGWISFRGVANADVFSDVAGGAIAPITFQGNNTFRLNSSSNTAAAAQSYTFDTGRGATNYVGLQLVNGNTAWRSANLAIGSAGSLLVSNTTASIAATLTSTGSVHVVNSIVTFSSNVTIVGSYRSDPSTNIYYGDLTVAQSGTLAGGLGDRFEFNKSSFFIHSTNNTGFNLASSSVAFTGGGMHTNAITGVDLGSSALAYATAFELQTNFAYGALHLGSTTDQVCFACGNIPAVSGDALYIGWLDLLGNTNLVTNLHATNGINIYYSVVDSRNAYLDDMTYQLTACSGGVGGFLVPVIPEPSTSALFVAAAALLFRSVRRGPHEQQLNPSVVVRFDV